LQESQSITQQNQSVLSKLDKDVAASFLNPHFVKTDTIHFEHKRKLPASSKSVVQNKKFKTEDKDSKMKHKFSFF